MVSVDEIRLVRERIRTDSTKRQLKRRLKFLELTAQASAVNERCQIRGQTLVQACKALTYAASGFVVFLCFLMASDAIARFAVASSFALCAFVTAREVGSWLDKLIIGDEWISVPLLNICEEHLERPVKANEHYLAVCRALVTEAVDLKSFLEKVSSTGESLKNFANVNNNNGGSLDGSQSEEFPMLNFTEWAHLWIQVVSDLRFGVKLKKVEGYTRNVEYELTPYEILMEDIRQRNFSLKKVAIDGEPPQRVNQNAHDIILDFIKSRPTLKPSENRLLRPPPPRSKSLHELLLEQIQGPPSPLRHVKSRTESTPPPSGLCVEQKQITASKSCDDILNNRTHRRTRLDAPPFAAELGVAVSRSSFLQSDSDDSCDDDDDSSSFAVDSIATEDLSTTTVHDDSMSPFQRHYANTGPCSLRSSGTSGVSSGGGDDPDASSVARPGTLARNASTIRKKKVLAVELLPSPVLGADSSFEDSFALADGGVHGRHSAWAGVRAVHSAAAVPHGRRLTWRERRALKACKSSAVDFLPSERSLPLLPPPCASSPVSRRDRRGGWTYVQDHSSPFRRTMSDRRACNPLRAQNPWNRVDECVKVTTKELISLREKLVAHDLEKYQGRGELYTNLRKGKICFNCRVREFNIFWWARTCEICKQKICSKCMRKVEAPVDESLQAPVYDLCPSLSPDDCVNRRFQPQDDYRILNSRHRVTSKFSVLRERNDSSVEERQFSDVVKSRKMDVCESCRDLISRALYMTTMYPPAREARSDAPELKRYVLGRPISVSDRLQRSASFMTSRSPPPFARRGDFGASRSIQGLQTAVE